MKKELTCIICPRGCALQVTGEKGSLEVTGNTCPKGREYAIRECTAPVRTVTSCVRVANREDTMVSVKTLNPIPKGKMMEAAQMLHGIRVFAPVKIGDVIVDSLFGSPVVATRDVE